MKNLIIGLLGVTLLMAGVAAHGDELDQATSLARKTLAFVQRSRPCPDLAAELARRETRSKGVSGDSAERAELCAEIRRLRRRILFAHPLLDFDRLLVNKCPPPGYAHQTRQYLGRYSRPGPGLVVLESWKDQPREVSLLKDKLPVGSVMHPDLSFDARRVVFAFCDHTPRDPNWRQFFLWEADVDGSRLHRLTGRAADRTAGAEGRETALVEDFDPCYLPDGGIAFVSTRSQTHIRCQYGFRYFANFLLYRADGDGSNIQPLSFAEAPEWKPSVLDDGRILYSRWDYTNRHSYHFQSLWVTRPDGTGTANVYGNLTRNPCNTGEPRQVPGSQKIVCTATAHHGYTAGSIILVDPRKGIDGLSPVTRITPEIAFPETEGWPVGAYATPYALSEDLFLAAYTPEPLVREGKVQSEAAYGIYLVDTLGGRELIYRDARVSCFSPIPLRPRPRPPVLPPAPSEAAEAATGVFFVKNVYQSTHALAAGSVKSLRVVRVFPQTVETPPSRSITPYEMPKKILGTACRRCRRLGGVSGPGPAAAAVPASGSQRHGADDHAIAGLPAARRKGQLRGLSQAPQHGPGASRPGRRRADLRSPAPRGTQLRRRPELCQNRPAGVGSLLYRLPRAGSARRRPGPLGHDGTGNFPPQAMARPQQDARQPRLPLVADPRGARQRGPG